LVEHNTEIEVDNQELTYKGRILENDLTITNYDIENNSSLNLIISNTRKILIILKMKCGITFPLAVNSTDTIKSVKDKIYKREGIPSFRQVLVFEGVILEDEEILKNYNIKENCAMRLEINLSKRMRGGIGKLIPLTVKLLDGRTFEFNKEIYDLNTVKELKDVIGQKAGLSKMGISLIMYGRRLEDNYTLKDYNIMKHTILHVINVAAG
jgi:ubiquitin C